MNAAFAWMASAVIASAILSMIVAIRELRRRNWTMAGLALICLALCGVASVQPMPTHAVKIDLPLANDR